MKLFLSFTAILFSFSLSAQNLYVGNVHLDDIPSEYIEMRATFLRPLNPVQAYAVMYGQECTRTLVLIQSRSVLENCTGLQDESGALITGYHYTEALTLLDQAGWELVDIRMDQSDGDSSVATDSVFLLKRKESDNRYSSD